MINKKKILIVNNNLLTGGVQKALTNLLQELKGQYKITLFLFSNSGQYKKNIPKEIKVIEANSFLKLLGISQSDSKKIGLGYYLLRVILVIWSKTFSNRLPIRFLVATQKKLGNFDVAISFLHSSNEKSFYGGCNEFVLERVIARKKVTFVHCDFLNYGGNTKKNQKVYKEFDQVATVSNGCRNRFIQAIPELSQKTICVINSQDYCGIKKMANDDPVVYSSNNFNLVTVARLSQEKGIIRTINIIKKLIDENYKIQWHLIGEGSQKSEIEYIIKTHSLEDNIILYGNQENPYRYMINADAFLLPSIHEAAPMVIDEAKFLGIPVITTNTTSAKEMVIDNREGFICDNSADDIYQKIKNILDDPILLLNSRNYLDEKEYSNDKAIEQFRQLLKN